jgi:hypothetical protein
MQEVKQSSVAAAALLMLTIAFLKGNKLLCLVF